METIEQAPQSIDEGNPGAVLRRLGAGAAIRRKSCGGLAGQAGARHRFKKMMAPKEP
jgi:hypothetical protein